MRWSSQEKHSQFRTSHEKYYVLYRYLFVCWKFLWKIPSSVKFRLANWCWSNLQFSLPFFRVAFDMAIEPKIHILSNSCLSRLITWKLIANLFHCSFLLIVIVFMLISMDSTLLIAFLCSAFLEFLLSTELNSCGF